MLGNLFLYVSRKTFELFFKKSNNCRKNIDITDFTVYLCICRASSFVFQTFAVFLLLTNYLKNYFHIFFSKHFFFQSKLITVRLKTHTKKRTLIIKTYRLLKIRLKQKKNKTKKVGILQHITGFMINAKSS